MESTRRFKPPWTLIRENSECYVVQDALFWDRFKGRWLRHGVSLSRATANLPSLKPLENWPKFNPRDAR